MLGGESRGHREFNVTVQKGKAIEDTLFLFVLCVYLCDDTTSRSDGPANRISMRLHVNPDSNKSLIKSITHSPQESIAFT